MLKKISLIFVIILSLSTSIIYANDNIASNNSDAPKINARYAVVIERNSKRVLYGKKEMEKSKMASTTKIMTAIVVIENANVSDTVVVSSKAARTGGSRLGLATNNKITVENLLYGLMMCSGNDAAVALAEHVGGSLEGFATLMNKKASELNLKSTHFVTPHGLDNDAHYTTAYELAILTDYALKNSTFAKIVKTKTHTITLNGHPKKLSNTNELLGSLEGVYGVKTGFTNGANRCLVTSCKRGNLDIICVVFGCDTKKDRGRDSTNLINYTFKNFSVINIKDIVNEDFNKWKLEHTNSFKINKGISQKFELYLDNSLEYDTIAVNNKNVKNITTSITFNSYYEAPVPSNTTIGKLSLFIDDTKYMDINILNSNEVGKKRVYDYFHSLISNYSNNFQFDS